MLQEYKIGKMLRENYDEFLGPIYKKSDVYAFSSFKDRTKESLMLVLSSLYPPVDDQKWNKEINWIPHALYSLPKELNILFRGQLCKK